MKRSVANKMTVQELCDYSIKALVKQGGRCSNDHGECKYANKEGWHCAIGHLTDERFHSGWDGIMSPMGELKGLPAKVTNNIGIFNALQTIHDSIEPSFSHIERLGVDTSGKHWDKWAKINE